MSMELFMKRSTCYDCILIASRSAAFVAGSRIASGGTDSQVLRTYEIGISNCREVPLPGVV